MARKPLAFYFLGIACLVAALMMPVQVATMYGHSLSEYVLVWNKLTYFNKIVFFALILHGVWFFKVDEALPYSLPILCLVIVTNNCFVFMGQTFSLFETFVSSLIPLAMLTYYAFSPLLEVNMDSNKQWWKIPTRKKVTTMVWLTPLKGAHTYLTRSFDISSTGIFLKKFNQAGEHLFPAHLPAGAVVDLKFKIGERKEEVICRAKVVRKTNCERGKYPSGMGLQFLFSSKGNQKDLERKLNSEKN